jgi:hypothetical protein
MEPTAYTLRAHRRPPVNDDRPRLGDCSPTGLRDESYSQNAVAIRIGPMAVMPSPKSMIRAADGADCMHAPACVNCHCMKRTSQSQRGPYVPTGPHRESYLTSAFLPGRFAHVEKIRRNRMFPCQGWSRPRTALRVRRRSPNRSKASRIKVPFGPGGTPEESYF